MPSKRRRTPTLLLAFGLAGLLACAGGEPDPAADADTLTRRQRDSVIGESRLPGAGGVRGALDASDAAADRNAVLDSLSRTP